MSQMRGDGLSDPVYSDVCIVALFEHSMGVCKRNIHTQFSRRLGVLATIGSTAPLIGFLGTVIGILRAFRGCSGPPWVCYTATLNGLSEALIFAALGLTVAVPACWAHGYFSSRLQTFDLEAACASSEIASYVAIRLSKRGWSGSGT